MKHFLQNLPKIGKRYQKISHQKSKDLEIPQFMLRNTSEVDWRRGAEGWKDVAEGWIKIADLRERMVHTQRRHIKILKGQIKSRDDHGHELYNKYRKLRYAQYWRKIFLQVTILTFIFFFCGILFAMRKADYSVAGVDSNYRLPLNGGDASADTGPMNFEVHSTVPQNRLVKSDDDRNAWIVNLEKYYTYQFDVYIVARHQDEWADFWINVPRAIAVNTMAKPTVAMTCAGYNGKPASTNPIIPLLAGKEDIAITDAQVEEVARVVGSEAVQQYLDDRDVFTSYFYGEELRHYTLKFTTTAPKKTFTVELNDKLFMTLCKCLLIAFCISVILVWIKEDWNSFDYQADIRADDEFYGAIFQFDVKKDKNESEDD